MTGSRHAGEVWRRLRALVPADDWASADPYLLRHAAEHAAEAGALPELIDEPEFLVHGVPTTTMAAVTADPDVRASDHAVVYRTSFAVHATADARDRRLLLELDARRFDLPAIADAIARPSGWRVRWTTGEDVSRAEVMQLAGHAGPVDAVDTFDRDGRPTAVSVDRSGTLRVWDLLTGVTGRRPAADPGVVSWVKAFTLDGGAPGVFGLYADGRACLWNLGPGEPVRRIAYPDAESPHIAAVLVDGRPCVLLWSRRRLVVRDALDDRVVTMLVDHPGPAASAAAVTFDGRASLLTLPRSDGRLRLWDLESGRCVRVFEGLSASHGGVAVVESAAGRQAVAIASDESTVVVWDLSDSLITQVHERHSTIVTCVAAGTIDGRPYAFTGSDQSVLQWDLGEASGPREFGDRELQGPFAPREFGDRELPGPFGPREFGNRELRGPFTPRQFGDRELRGHTHWVHAIALTILNGRPHAVTGGADGTARLWDLTRHKPARQHRRASWLHAVQPVRVDGRSCVLTAGDDGSVVLWEASSGRALRRMVGHSERVSAVAPLVLDGRPLAVSAGHDEAIRVWDLASGRTVVHVGGQYPPVTALATTAVAGRVLVFSADNLQAVRLWDPRTGGVRRKASTHPEGVLCAAAVPIDGRPHVVLGGHKGAVRVWDVSERAPQTEPTLLHRHEGPVLAVAAFPYGGRPHALTASADATVRLWDLDTHETVRTLIGHTDRVTAVRAVTADGTPMALTASHDNTIRLWDLATGVEVDRVTLPNGLLDVALTLDGAVAAAMFRELLVLEPPDALGALTPSEYPVPLEE